MATGFRPSSGAAGTLVEISGKNFSKIQGGNTVKFHSVAAAVQVETETVLLVPVPAGAETGPITVSNAAGTSVTEAIFHVLPSVTDVVPKAAAVGEPVAILGTGFDGEAPAHNVVTFNGVAATVVSSTATTIQTAVPVGATTGELFVSTPEGTASGGTFAVVLQPTVADLVPAFGPAGGLIGIFGANFEPDPAGNEVHFNGSPAAVALATESFLVVAVPAGATTGPVKVKTALGGTASQQPAFTLVVPRFALVANSGDGTVSTFLLDAASAQLRHQIYLHLGVGLSPRAVGLHPSGSLAFLTTTGTDSLRSYAVSASGTLSLVDSQPVGPASSALAVHPSGGSVYAVGMASSMVSAFSVGPAGALSFLENEPTGGRPTSVDLDPFGRFAYVTNSMNGGAGNSISVYKVEGGMLSPVEAQPMTGGPTGAKVHPNGRFFYAVAPRLNQVQAFGVASDGSLEPLQTVSTGTGPQSVAIDPGGGFLYVASNQGNTISQYRIQADGTLVALGSAVPTGLGPRSLPGRLPGEGSRPQCRRRLPLQLLDHAGNGGASQGLRSEDALRPRLDRPGRRPDAGELPVEMRLLCEEPQQRLERE